MDDLISRQAVQNYIAHFLSLHLQDNVREAVEAIDEVIGDMPSVAIPPDHDGCKDCVYQANPQDAMPCRECKHNYMDKWKARPKEEPRYCDRNICLRNEYNGISCDECEVGNPCLYCKHEFEPQESEE